MLGNLLSEERRKQTEQGATSGIREFGQDRTQGFAHLSGMHDVRSSTGCGRAKSRAARVGAQRGTEPAVSETGAGSGNQLFRYRERVLERRERRGGGALSEEEYAARGGRGG